ncbi:hypothetical protein [Achromobacter sp. UMC46]|uniref:hypothetical protein n=1 Tax=Achromobacter sp. UMC46 TaxID=1862319 RepID=UPI0016011E5D|nr:hypothetical protein [Achromobacter sp. UMC46]MBB1594366.1 hypothetical protein [Achromobacter sp. UMC46]
MLCKIASLCIGFSNVELKIMKRLSVKIAPIFALVILAGCTSAKPWATYTGTPETTSTITLVNAGKKQLWPLAFVDGEACYGVRYGVFSDGKYAGIMAPGSEVTFVAERDKTFSVLYKFMNPSLMGFKLCTGALTLIPRQGQYTLVGVESEDGDSCGMRVLDEAKKAVTTEITSRQFRQPFADNDGPWCQPIDDAQRAALENKTERK